MCIIFGRRRERVQYTASVRSRTLVVHINIEAAWQRSIDNMQIGAIEMN